MNVPAAEIPPPGEGLATVMASGPAAATSVPVSGSVICVPLITAAFRCVPFKKTVDVGMNSKPVIARVPPGGKTPAGVLGGEIETIAGTGLHLPVILKSTETENRVPELGPGPSTVMLTGPQVERSAADMSLVVRVFELTKVVCRSSPFQ